ncbi:MAG: magnesium transporter CorA family protein, partial [Thaumarchaeota archaeon]|nr:magnesium transporter CorA family protein [Nitrososphaerota archaeon]
MPPAETRPSWTTVALGKSEWVDIQDPTQEDVDALARRYPFHPLNLEDCLSNRQLTRVEDHESHVFVLMHFPTINHDGHVVRSQLTMFVGEDYLVSLHGSALALVRETAQALGPDDRLRASMMESPAHLVYSVIDKLVDGLFPLLDKLRGDLDAIEDDVFDEKISPAARINSLRRKIADLQRVVTPLRLTVQETWEHLKKYSSKELEAYFTDVLDHMNNASEVLQEARETIEIYKDTNFLMSADKTNRVLIILTIIFTLTLPAAIVAAIYGMNVALPLGNGQNPPTILGP